MTIQRVTPETAATWLETMPYDHQRSLSQQWVDYLAEEMRRGTFKQDTTISVAALNGRPNLIDGQHRLWAVIQSNLPQSFIVYTVQARDEDHVAWMYGTTDIGRTRPTGMLWRGLGLPAELGLTQTQTGFLSSAITFMRTGLAINPSQAKRAHPEEQIDAIRLYAPHALRFFGMIAGQAIIVRAGQRAATLAVALLTLRYTRDSDVAERFWRAVAADDGLKANDPRKYANKHLANTALMNGRRSGAIIVSQARSARILATCFNAYATGREILQTPKVLDESAPVNIIGVPRDYTKWLE